MKWTNKNQLQKKIVAWENGVRSSDHGLNKLTRPTSGREETLPGCRLSGLRVSHEVTCHGGGSLQRFCKSSLSSVAASRGSRPWSPPLEAYCFSNTRKQFGVSCVAFSKVLRARRVLSRATKQNWNRTGNFYCSSFYVSVRSLVGIALLLIRSQWIWITRIKWTRLVAMCANVTIVFQIPYSHYALCIG